MQRDNQDFRNDRGRFENPERLGMSHGNNSRRGNYTIDSHFNAEDGAYGNEDYDNQTGFNTNADSRHMYPQGRFSSGGATYSGR
ncbi:MAG: hypothetical protein LPK19_12580, partial [Hymenobacteraceae bacterium]|nr:hypothetical protein [Hymenobacteraceae bacterium]MDX5397068.1 hypothetical protein [Hymenobacteraceae bacterium]MDX5513138.1 hypothetical protein [Hymenobacteraceae bacterium]